MPFILPTSLRGRLGSFSLAHYPQTSFLGTLDMPLLAIFIGAVMRWDLTFSLISRSWHGIDRQAALLIMCITTVTGSPQHGPVVLCNGPNEMRISSQYVFSHSAPPASSEIMTGIAKLLRYPHLVSSWKFSVTTALERNLTKGKPLVCWQYHHRDNQ